MSDDEGETAAEAEIEVAEPEPIDGAPDPVEGPDSDDENEEEAGADAPSVDDQESSEVAPTRTRVDPILRRSNRARQVIVIRGDDRVTDNRLQITEAALLLSMRAEQIAKYVTTFVETPGVTDPGARAFAELFARRCPLLLRRLVGTDASGAVIVEEWNPCEMTLPALTPPRGSGLPALR